MVCVLFNAGRKDELTSECRLRIKAGLTIENATLCLVGEKTWLMKTICSDRFIIELNNCSDTIGNIREIEKFARQEGFHDILIISSSYHLRRIKLLLNIIGLEADVRAAEDIMGVKKAISFTEPLIYFATLIFWKLRIINKQKIKGEVNIQKKL